jgi:hypothetical protein
MNNEKHAISITRHRLVMLMGVPRRLIRKRAEKLQVIELKGFTAKVIVMKLN